MMFDPTLRTKENVVHTAQITLYTGDITENTLLEFMDIIDLEK